MSMLLDAYEGSSGGKLNKTDAIDKLGQERDGSRTGAHRLRGQLRSNKKRKHGSHHRDFDSSQASELEVGGDFRKDGRHRPSASKLYQGTTAVGQN
jgi:hypothetical protein